MTDKVNHYYQKHACRMDAHPAAMMVIAELINELIDVLKPATPIDDALAACLPDLVPYEGPKVEGKWQKKRY